MIPEARMSQVMQAYREWRLEQESEKHGYGLEIPAEMAECPQKEVE